MTTMIPTTISSHLEKLFKRPEIRIANVGDIHLGNRLNPSSYILRNLYTLFPDNAETAQLDIIILTGDVFDRLLSLPDQYAPEIKMWTAHMLRLCAKHDILLRVLEGTPSHDWKQSQLFESINEVAGIGADLKYVKNLSIEYIERFGITVLYVPDEANSTTDKTLSQVQALLRERDLDRVDFAFMHGQFDYQLPEISDHGQKHQSAAYLSLVKELIFVGHVHIHSRYDRILAPGSIDRLRHNEEGPKGHLRAVCKRDGTYDITFVETVNAMKFITIPCGDLNLDDTRKLIDQTVKGLPNESHLRVEANTGHPILSNLDDVKRQYPQFNWAKIDRKAKEKAKEEKERFAAHTPVTITKDNITKLLMERLSNKERNPEVTKAMYQLLAEAL